MGLSIKEKDLARFVTYLQLLLEVYDLWALRSQLSSYCAYIEEKSIIPILTNKNLVCSIIFFFLGVSSASCMLVNNMLVFSFWIFKGLHQVPSIAQKKNNKGPQESKPLPYLWSHFDLKRCKKEETALCSLPPM